ncbi:hypothetical protein DVH05_019860 [Phytophthora capsici]|nr:hypothetical protein DVH05_019860 [Phytophthora capsici]
MTTSSYQLWLKKREFKAPHPPPSATAMSTAAKSPTMSKESLQHASNSSQSSCVKSQTYSSKFHAVSGVETTHVSVKAVSRPSATKKRARGWLSDGGEAAVELRRSDTKVAQVNYVAESNVAESNRVRSSKELMNTTTIKLANLATVLRQSSAKRDAERAVWPGRVDREPKVAARVDSDAIAAKRVKSSVLSLKQSDDTNRNEMGKNRRLVIDSAHSGADGSRSTIGQLRNSRPQKHFEKAPVDRKRGPGEKTSGVNTMKRLRFDGDRDESELSGLPPKSPLKLGKIRTAMLDESQYWMAVDRFSHLT